MHPRPFTHDRSRPPLALWLLGRARTEAFNNMNIRPETAADAEAIWHVNRLAFARDHEARLVDALREGGFVPWLPKWMGEWLDTFYSPTFESI
jgi:hypothetical protein